MLFHDLSDFMTFILFPELLKGSGEFPSLPQYNLGIGKGEGKVEGVGVKGMGSEWSCRLANSTIETSITYTHRCRIDSRHRHVVGILGLYD